MCPNSIYMGLKVLPIGVHWAQSIYYLGTWTLNPLNPKALIEPLQAALTVEAKKLETGLRPNSAGIPYTLLLRIEAIGFPTFELLL